VPKTLIVEGWRFLSHSYAMVNQWQLLALARRTDVALRVIDAPYARAVWRVQERLFDERSERVLRSLEPARRDEGADVTLRIFAPYDFSPSPSRETAIFATSESQTIRRDQVADPLAYERLRAAPPANVRVITPSRWSAEGFHRFGFTPEQVVVVPHGADIGTFHPMPHARAAMRERWSIAEEEFVFLSIGAMTGNKGIDLLVRAFAEVSRALPHARLVLKGTDPLYGSKRRVLRYLEELPAADQRRIADRVTYIGDALSIGELAELYQLADTYVSPYRAEGFNLPVLEAAACGIPVLCTAGGATEDFVTDGFARRIESTRMSHSDGQQEFWRLEPRLDHLIELMRMAAEDASWRRRAHEEGPRHVAEGYTWDRAVDRLARTVLN
jgi:glycosyltransferase involved in cell wall biosynthesis